MAVTVICGGREIARCSEGAAQEMMKQRLCLFPDRCVQEQPCLEARFVLRREAESLRDNKLMVLRATRCVFKVRAVSQRSM